MRLIRFTATRRAGHSQRLLLTAAMTVVAAAHLGAAPLSLESRKVAIPENGFASEVVIRTTQSEISLLPPPHWRLSIDTNSTTLTWQTPDFRSMLRLRLVTGASRESNVSKDSLRERVRTEFPSAEVLDEAECYAATHSGTGFELEESKTRFPSVTRLAFLPFDGGRLELQLTCPLEEAERARHRLTSVMNSLHIVPR